MGIIFRAWWSSIRQDEGLISWDALARELGDPAVQDAAMWRSGFQESWSNVVARSGLAACIQARSHILYPFSGGDVGTLLAMNPRAQGYVMLSNMPAFAPEGWHTRNSWLHNRTRLESATQQAAEIIRLSHSGGYQYGHLLRRFAAQHGAVLLLLAVVGSLRDVIVESVLPITEIGQSGVELHCRRGDAQIHRFWIRYIEIDLRDREQLSGLEELMIKKWVGSRALMILKGAESALQLRNEEAEAFRVLRPDTIAAAREESILHNVIARHIAASLLRMSDVVIQDVTGAQRGTTCATNL